MGGGSKSQTVGYKYYLGMHMALCHGPIDYLLALLVDKKVAWGGQQATNGQLTVAAEGLFGGEDREGGVSGTLDYEMGGPTQPVNSYLAGKQGGDVPAYRGIVGLVLKKMYLGMNPYLKPWSAVAQRVFVRQDGVEQWYITKAAIANPSAQAVGYSPRFQEQFESISPYTVVSGDGSLFGVSGGTMMIGTQNAGTVARIKRTIPSTTFSKLTMKVQLPLVGAATDDAAIIEFMNGNTVVFTVNPMREQAFDSQRRPRFYYNGSDNFMGSALTPATWYRFTWEMNQDTGAWSASFVRDSDGAVHATASGSGVTPATVDGIRFTVDSGGQTVTAQYREITMYSTGGVGVDMNPAHIIRECLTDPDWGMGYEEADIDDVSFRAAADTLYAEGMGMSLLWDRQIPIEDFIKEVLKHIDGTVYVSRSTGQFVLKLIRDDYDEGSLLVLDESNVVKVDNYSERRFDEMVNSVTVKYTDAATWNDAAVEVQDIAQVHMQNAVINTTVNYPGFMYAALASRAGARDLKTLSTPLATCTIYANLEAKDLNIGDAFKFTWPDYQVSNLVMRVTAISFGDGKDNTVKISCTQDSFATPSAEYVVTDPGEWTDPNGPPTPAEATKAFEIPYYEIVRAVGQTAADNQITANGDLGYAGVAAAAPASGAINATMMSDAGAGFENVGTLDFCPSATIATGIGFLDTTVTLENGSDLDGVVAGSHAQIDDEHIVIVSLVGDVLTFKRGALDTVPMEHATGARIFFWGSNDSLGYDPTEYNAGESVDIRVLPVTGQGQLALGDADTDTVVMDTRAARPYPPGNVKINGDYYPATVEDALVLTWAHRDRKQQTGGTLLDFTSASVGPENGTVYNARLVDPATDDVLAEQTGISGTTVTLDAAFAGIAHVELESVRDGLPSFQKHVIPVDFAGGDVILTETEGALLTEGGEGLLIENLNVGSFGVIVQQEASDVRDGNRQVVYFRFSGSPTDAQLNPPKPQVFSYSCQKMQTPNPSQFFHTAQSTLSSVIGGGFSNQYSYIHERLCFLVSDAGVPQDKGISSAASAVGADVTAYKRNPTPGGLYPSDWCSNFDTNGGAEGAGYDYCIVFPVGEKVVWRWSPTQLSGAGAGDWEFMLYTTPDYPIAPTVRLDVKLGSGFLDKVTTARPKVSLVYFDSTLTGSTAAVAYSTYAIILDGEVFSYFAQPGDTIADVKTALAAAIDAHADYTATAAYAPYIQITGPAPVNYTIEVKVQTYVEAQRTFIRPLFAHGGKVYSMASRMLPGGTLDGDYFVSEDDGLSYTEILSDSTTFGAYPDGVKHWDAVLSNGVYASLGLNEYANIAGQIVGDVDLLPGTLPTRSENNNVSQNHRLLGYPRTGGGDVIHTGALWSDGTYFYIVGRKAVQTQTSGAMYLYRAGSDMAFTELGQLTKDGSDPNAIPDGHYGSFQSFWFVPNSGGSSIYNSRSIFKKIGSRWWLISTLAVYYTDASDGLTGWKRAPLGFSEDTATNPPALIIDVVDCGGGLLYAINGQVTLLQPNVSISTDGGDTWTAYKPSAMSTTDSLRLPVFFDGKLWTYFYGGSNGQKYAYAVAPYGEDDWTVGQCSGIEFYASGYGRSVAEVFVSGSRMYARSNDGVLLYSDDGIAFKPALLL